jgi:hypothetical protein
MLFDMSKMFKQFFPILLLFLPLLTRAQNPCIGGEVTAFGGATRVYTCPGDGKPDVVIFARSGHSESANYQFVITNEQNTILAIPPGSRADLEGAGVGLCFVYGFAYTGNLTAAVGDNVFSTKFSTGCWGISRTRLDIVRAKPDGGTVQTRNGQNSVSLCTQDGYDDPVLFSKNTGSPAAYRFLITDSQNNILAIKDNDNQDFEGVPGGICRVWGLSYTGNLLAQAGTNAASANLSSGCWDLSDNFITVDRTNVDGGEVRANGNATRVLTVPGDGQADVITVSHTTNSTANYRYIVTDDKNVVLGVPPANTVNAEGAGPGLCRIWGISYTGTLDVYPGDKVGTKALASGCFSLSKNYIEVVRNRVDGGTVAMPNGLTTRYTCPGDNKPDVVRFTNSSLTTAAAQYRYVVTDGQNNILALPPAAEANVEGAGPGVCRVWGVSFLGDFTAQVGQNAATAALASGAFDLSDNYIAIHRAVPQGGTVAMPNGLTTRYTCPGDGQPDVVRFTTTSQSDTRYRYIVTDNQNNILALPPAAEANLEGAGEGVCRIWGVAYTGNFTAQVGQNAATAMLSDDCFDLSDNFISTVRFKPEGGQVATANGQTTVTVTVGDGQADQISFAATGQSGARFAWVVTDDQNRILALPNGNTINVEAVPPGICRVWGLSYTGAITALPGDNAAAVSLSTECYDLSGNFVTINRVAQLQSIGERAADLRTLTREKPCLAQPVRGFRRFAPV